MSNRPSRRLFANIPLHIALFAPFIALTAMAVGLVGYLSYLNGQEAARSSAVRGDLSNWTRQHLLLGDEWQDSRHWHGRIERLALHNRFIAAEEARTRSRLSLAASR